MGEQGMNGKAKPPGRAMRMSSNPAAAWLSRGVANLDAHKYAAAIADLNRALRLDPNDVVSLYNRATSQLALGNHAEAVADYTRAIELGLTLTDAYANRGVAYGYLGRYDEGLADLQRAAADEPHSGKAAYNLAWIHALRHEAAPCLQHLRRAVGLDASCRVIARADAADFAWLVEHDAEFAAAFRAIADDAGDAV